MKDYYWIVSLPAITGGIIAEIIFFTAGGTKMNNVVTITIPIVVALIAVIGSILTTLVTIKREGKTIADIFGDTRHISPVVDNISEKTTKINDYTIERIYPKVSEIDAIKEAVGYIRSDVEFRQRLENETKSLPSLEHLTAQINKVYLENAELKRRLGDNNTKLNIIYQENISLKTENMELKKEIEELTPKVDPMIPRR